MDTSGKSIISKKETKERIRALATQPNDTACIIFGAGASFGYSHKHTYKSPMVKDLFDISNNVVAKVIARPANVMIKSNRQYHSNELNNFEHDLEKYLSFLYLQDKNDNLFANFLTYLEDIYFLSSEEIVTGANNYQSLINLMRGLHGTKLWSCISFNYDTLLEKSYLAAGRDTVRRNFGDLASYIDINPVILKMHGGINFRYIFRKSLTEGDPNGYTSHTLFSEMMSDKRTLNHFLEIIDLEARKPDVHSIETLADDASDKEGHYSQFNFPLMLIPVHGSIAPENIFFQEQIKRSKEAIERASLIIAIGYNFGDDSFVDGLREIDFSKKEVILVNTTANIRDIPNNLGFQRVRKAWAAAKIRIFDGNGFSEFIRASY